MLYWLLTTLFWTALVTGVLMLALLLYLLVAGVIGVVVDRVKTLRRR